MTENLEILQLSEDDVCKLLATKAHLGHESSNFQMKLYLHPKERNTAQRLNIIDIGRMWEKVILAARAIAAIEHPHDIVVVSARKYGQRAILKFAQYTGATAVAGRFTPGKFTNQQQTGFLEPRLLMACDPIADHQAITESSFVNLPVIALANVNSPLKFVDIAIPCNNQGNQAVGLMWWFLTREVLRLRGSISRETEWDVLPDLFIYREPEEESKEEEALDPSLPKFEDFGGTKPQADVGTQWQSGTGGADEWAALGADDWSAPAKQTSYNQTAPAADDWSATPATTDWSAAPVAAAPADNWSAAPAANDWSAVPTDTSTTATDWSAPVADDWAAATDTGDGWGAH